ncbi:hypothetical protein FB45DRAFT_1094488 [Roridomyces roridus]|uniref:Uncharacterized protein n=1 Tax=Roridomyces roridus TaxID=1738132 RepID=A0AAD7FHF5_9AGAR|nr:hypothetical protein FB45DRAFT_1094488 [Roridomyces roridus]
MALPLSDDRPVFPPEIERHIFELSALARPVLVPKLIFVAWRIKQWIEPILYRTIVLGRARSTMDGYPAFTSEALLSAIQTKAPGFIATAVQNLSIYDSAAGYEEILSACTGVTNLRVLSLDTAFSAHIPSTLTQLYVYDFPHESSAFLFSQLTHLDVMGLNFLDIDLDAFHSSVALLPHLTHVSFSDRDYTPIFLRLLRGCPKIEVFFYCDQDDEPLLDQETLAEDPRFVVLRLRAGTMWNWDYDWLMGVHCGRDYWYRVERFIQKRRSGEVDRFNPGLNRTSKRYVSPGMA